jgi:hypothetical protein
VGYTTGNYAQFGQVGKADRPDEYRKNTKNDRDLLVEAKGKDNTAGGKLVSG